jgi:transcriptional regulator with XRE-family HTH domain
MHPLDAWRLRKGWSKAQLASALGMHPSNLSNVLAGCRLGLPKRAVLAAYDLVDGEIPLRVLLLGPEQLTKPKPRRKRTAA